MRPSSTDALPGENFSYAYAANGDGSVIVGGSSSANLTSAVRWTKSRTTGFGPLPGDVYAALYATNEDGSVAVGVSAEVRPPHIGVGHALIWDETLGSHTVESDLSRAGVDIGTWKLRHASAVSANGRVITGFGKNPDGYAEAWIARLP